MKIVDIREMSAPLEREISHSVVSFADHDVSLVAVVSDVIRNGRPVIGYGFNSIDRFGQGGILRARILPRLLAAASIATRCCASPCATRSRTATVIARPRSRPWNSPPGI